MSARTDPHEALLAQRTPAPPKPSPIAPSSKVKSGSPTSWLSIAGQRNRHGLPNDASHVAIDLVLNYGPNFHLHLQVGGLVSIAAPITDDKRHWTKPLRGTR
jgi:hypothetical protein